MSDTITYDEPGVTYDDHCYLYDGVNICHPQPPDTRPIYWKGRAGRPERKKKPHFTSMAVTAKCLSVNGYDVDFSFCADEVRFAGEEDDTEVTARAMGASTVDEPYQVQGDLASDEENLEEDPEGELLEGEEADEFEVSGGIQDEDDNLLVESWVLTGSNQDLTLSCHPVTNSQDTPIITIAVVMNERDEDPEDEG